MKGWLFIFIALLAVLFGFPAYGLTTYRTGTNDTPFLFNGRYGVQSDPNGLLYMQARYYNPYLCRFISSDPSGFGGGLNTYAYANGNPVSLIDPFGLGAHESSVDLSWFNAPTASQMQAQTILADFVNLATLGTANDAATAFTGRDLYGNISTRQEQTVAVVMLGMVFIPGGKAEETASRAGTELGTAFADLSKFRSELGGIPARGGAIPNGGTLARLDTGGSSFYGMSAHGQPTLIGNDFNFGHAEIDALQQAFMADKLQSTATMFVDNQLCKFCRRADGLPQAVKDLGMQHLIIHDPVNSWRIASHGTTMIPRP